jgi:N-acetylated-alpha-linked acidic dipeptidase
LILNRKARKALKGEWKPKPPMAMPFVNPDPTEDRFDGLPALGDSVWAFGIEARRLDLALDALAVKDGARAEAVEALDGALTRLERAFLLPKGLDGRPWFKHAIYAPGVTTGYASWPLPAVREAIESSKADDLKAGIATTTAAINAAASALKRASELAVEAAKSVPAR